MPDPQRKDGAGGGNQESYSVRGRKSSISEQSYLHSRAEKPDRAGEQGFLDSVAIEPGLRDGDFRGRICAARQEQQQNTGSAHRRFKDREKQRNGRSHNDQ